MQYNTIPYNTNTNRKWLKFWSTQLVHWPEMLSYSIVWYCIAFHCIIWYTFYFMVVHGIVLYCIVLHCIVWYLNNIILCYLMVSNSMHAIALLALARGLCLARRLHTYFIYFFMMNCTSRVRMIPMVERRRGKNAQGFNQLKLIIMIMIMFPFVK